MITLRLCDLLPHVAEFINVNIYLSDYSRLEFLIVSYESGTLVKGMVASDFVRFLYMEAPIEKIAATEQGLEIHFDEKTRNHLRELYLSSSFGYKGSYNL